MSRLRRNLSKLNNLFRNNRAEEELAREVASHLTLLADDFERRGMSPEEAQLAAKRAYGGVEQAKQAHRDERSPLWIEQTIQDLRYALRMLAKSPGFAAVAILTLALGIGANTAIFSVIDAVMLRALPAEDPQRLVIFSWSSHHEAKLHEHSDYGDCDDNGHTRDCSFSVPFYEALRSQTKTFSGVTAFAGPLEVGFSGNGPANIARGEYVSGDYFSTVGAKTIVGRPLGLADDAPNASPAIVLDYGYWQRAFGADPSAVGRTVRLNNVDVAIVGVAEPGFTSLTPGKSQDFFMPLSLAEARTGRMVEKRDRLTDPAIWWVVLAGRLKPGISIEQAQAEATTLFHAEVLHAAKPIFSEGDAPAASTLAGARGFERREQPDCSHARTHHGRGGLCPAHRLRQCGWSDSGALCQSAEGVGRAPGAGRRTRADCAPAPDREPGAGNHRRCARRSGCCLGRARSHQVGLKRPRSALPVCHRPGLARAGVHQRRYPRHRHPVRPCAQLPQRARRPYAIAQGECVVYLRWRVAGRLGVSGQATHWLWRRWRSR